VVVPVVAAVLAHGCFLVSRPTSSSSSSWKLDIE
jgi:hypothetical protein